VEDWYSLLNPEIPDVFIGRFAGYVRAANGWRVATTLLLADTQAI
jgi:hypothetical protein